MSVSETRDKTLFHPISQAFRLLRFPNIQTLKICFKLPGVPQRDGMPVAGVGIGFLLSSSNLQDGICFCSEGRNSIFQDQIMTEFPELESPNP